MSGRPHALDDVKQAEVCALVSTGVSLRSAARYVGCDRKTIRREQLRNEKFAADMRQAEMQAEYAPLEAVHRAVHCHWRAAAWLLERTRPQRFTRHSRNARHSRNVIKLEIVHDLVKRIQELVAAELAPLPNGEPIGRRLSQAVERTYRELAVGAVVNRNPERRRRAIARPSVPAVSDGPEDLGVICMADMPPLEQTAASQLSHQWGQNVSVAAK